MFIIDRIENDIAVVEFNEMFFDVPLSAFKEEVHEGDVLFLTVDKAETENRKNKNKDLLFKLFNKNRDD